MITKVYDKGGCVGCPPEIGCMGKACPQCWKYIITCDMCKRQTNDVWRVDGVDLCQDCMFFHPEIVHINYDNCEDFAE